MARHADDVAEPLDAEAILIAYEARYGKEAAEWERKYLASGWLHSARLHVLQQALASSAWLQGHHSSLSGHHSRL
jgi:hypothetical protein